MAANTQSMQKYHNEFLTAEYAQSHVDEVYSDHLPVFYSDGTTNILSWNLYRDGLTSGYDLPLNPFFTLFDDSRHKRLIDSIEGIIENMTVDAVCLQEVDPSLYKLLVERFAESSWRLEFKQRAFVGYMITIFNTANLEYVGEVEHGRENDDVLSIKLNRHNTDQPDNIILSNVHISHDDFPDRSEKKARELFVNSDEHCAYHFMVGDWNDRIAPLDETPKNIITALTPCQFRNEQGEGADWTDGGFYRERDNKIVQMQKHIISPVSHREVLSPPLSDADMNPFQSKEVNAFRMMLCLDSQYESQIICNGSNIFELERQLKIMHHDDDLLIRISSNANNVKALGVRLSNHQHYTFLKAFLTDLESSQFNNKPSFQMPMVKTVYVPIENADRLIEGLYRCPSAPAVHAIEYKVMSDFLTENPFPKRFSPFKKNPTSILCYKYLHIMDKFGEDPILMSILRNIFIDIVEADAVKGSHNLITALIEAYDFKSMHDLKEHYARAFDAHMKTYDPESEMLVDDELLIQNVSKIYTTIAQEILSNDIGLHYLDEICTYFQERHDIHEKAAHTAT